jgi:pimeloyl-ACP methyl ester carboxylesterase
MFWSPDLFRPESAPPLSLLFGELRVARDWAAARTRPVAMDVEAVGNGAPILTMPGFMAADMSMAQMRRSLNAAGFKAKRWKMGINSGATADLFDRLDARVQHVTDTEGRAVHLVGWSLGGVFAREYAKRHPTHVASVITMGSPFSGNPRANNAWRLYELVAGHKVDAPPVELHPDPKPPVPTYALWSPSDGVVSPASAAGLTSERDRAIQLACVHMGFAFSAEATKAVIDCVLEVEQRLARQ